jgi:hypothetical protein
VAVVISLCDSLALCRDTVAIPRLAHAMSLKHRRIQVEAAAALARLGEPSGTERLVDLVSEPIARLRAISYLEELGKEARVPEQYATPAARAQAELVTCLSEPFCMGVPPTSCELLDERQQFWPGYDDRVPCYLFQFSYKLSRGLYQNVGMAGPLVHAFRSDISFLTHEDIYAVFAGWQAEHDAIRELPVASDTRRDADFERLRRHAVGEGFDQLNPLMDATWFGQRVLVARAERDGQSGIVVVEDDAVRWYPRAMTRTLEAELVYCLDKGRKLLRTFNELADEP